MKREHILFGGVLFILVISIFFSGVIKATPPSGACTTGTHWCENNGRTGDQEYVCNGDGQSWGGPYACPNGCDGVGGGHGCKASPSTCTEGDGVSLSFSLMCMLK